MRWGGFACIAIAGWSLVLLCAACGRETRSGRSAEPRSQAPAGAAAFAASVPRVMVWAWEEPEDLRALDPQQAGVAFLAETVVVGARVRVVPRHQPLRLGNGTPVMAVVRIQAERGFSDSPELRFALTRELGLVAMRPGLRALQVDFDAVESQHAFYRAVLERLAAEMPPGMPLSVTALQSWCGPDSWLRGLPVAEAVPMFFRMGGPPAHSAAVRTPLNGSAVNRGLAAAMDGLRAPCLGSVGVSNDEPWPPIPAGVRVYLFSPRPWTGEQLQRVNELDRARLAGGG